MTNGLTDQSTNQLTELAGTGRIAEIIYMTAKLPNANIEQRKIRRCCKVVVFKKLEIFKFGANSL